MNNLIGKTILIGKEPGQGCLSVAIVGGKTAAIGNPDSVPNSVSCCRAGDGIPHAKNLDNSEISWMNSTL